MKKEAVVILICCVIAVVAVIAVVILRNANNTPVEQPEFETVNAPNCFTIENQDGAAELDNENMIFEYYNVLLADENQFVTITSPQLQNDVRYIQACQLDKGIDIQLGVEKNGKTKLYHKVYSKEEAVSVFKDFYNQRFIPDMSLYELVEF